MSTIKAAVRIRPFLKGESNQGYKNGRLHFDTSKGEVSVREEGSSNKRSFRFDYLLSHDSSQEEVYEQCGVDEMVGKALEGYHSTVFAYGQTGSGKTHTMQGAESPQDVQQLSGLIPRAVKSLFAKANAQKSQRTFTFAISFLQIYSEKIYDLLNPASLNNKSLSQGNPQDLRLRWNKDQQFTVENLFVFQCRNEKELMKHFWTGTKNRISAAHKLNVQSSRSHTIFTVRIESFDNANPSYVRHSRLELVDLAGSERLSQTGTEGRLAKESIDINKSLFTLRQVINILAEKNNPKLKKEEKSHAPYRDSKLTSLLKQSIGGNSYSLMIACLTPNDAFLDENISTLTYATRASYITNCPVRNDDPKVKTINQLKRQLKDVTGELEKANQHIEFLSSLNQNSEKIKPQPGSPKKKVKPQYDDNDMPEPAFKKQLSEKLGSYDASISERLIESINMVRELLKSNKDLREKLEQSEHQIEHRDMEIYDLSRENELLREGKEIKSFRELMSGGESPESKVPLQRPPTTQKAAQLQAARVEPRNTPSVQSKRLSFKINSVIQKGQMTEQASTEAMRGRVMKGGVSLDMTRLHINEKGADTAPTNFNKRLTSTSQDRRNLYSRGTTPAQEDRHAITAKFSKRGWAQKDSQPRRFLSFYDDLRPNPFD